LRILNKKSPYPGIGQGQSDKGKVRTIMREKYTMNGYKSQYPEDFCEEHEIVLEFYLRRNEIPVMDDLKIAYHDS
jgi:hypothetical protein